MRFFDWKLILQFYATIAIPILYLIDLVITNKYSDTMYIPPFVVILGIIVSVIGLILWSLSYLHLGKSFGVLPKKTKRVSKGLYKYFRHPMYVSIWLTFFGLAIANKSFQGVVFLNLVLLPVLFFRAKLEERKLYD